MDGLYEQFRIALHQVWRRRWLAMAVAWGVAVAGWLVIALIPNSYEAKARLFVQMQSILPNQIGITVDERQNQLLRLKQTLTSNENLVRVVRRSDLNSLVASDRDMAGVASGLRTASPSPPSPTVPWRSRRRRTFRASPTPRTPAPLPPPSRA
jgi:uncharacterized protein involved in exopolysaccharide biosynthesis